MAENTAYIDTTMGNSPVGTNTVSTRDHFWNVGSNEDGRHRFMQSPRFTVGGLAANPVIGSGMDGVTYLKEINGRVEVYYRNDTGTPGIYQLSPSYQIGTVTISGGGVGDWVTLAPVPANTYGQVFMFRNNDFGICQDGIFCSTTYVRAFSSRNKQNGVSTDYFVELRNDSTASLNIMARLGNSGASSNGIWNYRITWRQL